MSDRDENRPVFCPNACPSTNVTRDIAKLVEIDPATLFTVSARRWQCPKCGFTYAGQERTREYTEEEWLRFEKYVTNKYPALEYAFHGVTFRDERDALRLDLLKMCMREDLQYTGLMRIMGGGE